MSYDAQYDLLITLSQISFKKDQNLTKFVLRRYLHEVAVRVGGVAVDSKPWTDTRRGAPRPVVRNGLTDEVGSDCLMQTLVDKKALVHLLQ